MANSYAPTADSLPPEAKPEAQLTTEQLTLKTLQSSFKALQSIRHYVMAIFWLPIVVGILWGVIVIVNAH